jgi:hypothetical protein
MPARCRSPRRSRRAGARTRPAARCGRPQDRHRARAGRSRTTAPPSSHTCRSRTRPRPHRRSRPLPHDGQASTPPAGPGRPGPAA